MIRLSMEKLVFSRRRMLKDLIIYFYIFIFLDNEGQKMPRL